MKDETRIALESMGMNIPQTLSRFVGNEGLLFRFLNRLPGETTYAQLREAMAAGNAQEAFHHAHTFKGVVGNLGLGTLFDAVSPVVELLRAGEMEQAEAQFPPVAAAYEYAIKTIQSLSE